MDQGNCAREHLFMKPHWIILVEEVFAWVIPSETNVVVFSFDLMGRIKPGSLKVCGENRASVPALDAFERL